MVEIDIAKVHQEIKYFFKSVNWYYSLTEKVRFDMLIRKLAPCYYQNPDPQDCEHDLAIVILDTYLGDFYRIPSTIYRDRGTFDPTEYQQAAAVEEDRRIEEMEVWRF